MPSDDEIYDAVDDMPPDDPPDVPDGDDTIADEDRIPEDDE